MEPPKQSLDEMRRKFEEAKKHLTPERMRELAPPIPENPRLVAWKTEMRRKIADGEIAIEKDGNIQRMITLVKQIPENHIGFSPRVCVHVDTILGERKLICGISGSGKSNTVANLIEGLAPLKMPIFLFDTENEYGSLLEGDFLPNGIQLDRSNLSTANAGTAAVRIIQNRQQAIVNLLDFSVEHAATIMITMVKSIIAYQESFKNEDRIPVEVILEEAVTWLPQMIGESPLKDSSLLGKLQNVFFNDIVRKGRKKGVGFTVVCQKLAELDKRAMQASVRFLHRQDELLDIKRYQDLGIEPGVTTSLKDGEAIVWVGSFKKFRTQINRRKSKHGAATPKLANLQASSPASKPVVEPMPDLPMKQVVETQVLLEEDYGEEIVHSYKPLQPYKATPVFQQASLLSKPKSDLSIDFWDNFGSPKDRINQNNFSSQINRGQNFGDCPHSGDTLPSTVPSLPAVPEVGERIEISPALGESIPDTFTAEQEIEVVYAALELSQRGEKITRAAIKEKLGWSSRQYDIIKAVCDKRHIG